MENIQETIQRILITQRYIVLINNGSDGYPAGRVMSAIENSPEGELWFVTHSTSGKVSGLREDPRAMLLWFEQNEQLTVHLKGKIEILEDEETKEQMWHKRWIEIWPEGPKDPDYILLRFIPETMSYFDDELRKTMQVDS